MMKKNIVEVIVAVNADKIIEQQEQEFSQKRGALGVDHILYKNFAFAQTTKPKLED